MNECGPNLRYIRMWSFEKCFLGVLIIETVLVIKRTTDWNMSLRELLIETHSIGFVCEIERMQIFTVFIYPPL